MKQHTRALPASPKMACVAVHGPGGLRRTLPALLALLALPNVLTLGACGDTKAEAPGFEEGTPLSTGKADGWQESVAAYRALPEGADLGAAISVLFAPDDPVISLELAQIQEIVDRRQADPETYAEGSNPFQIRYAVYNLRNEAISDALIVAAAAGVDVQVLIEADQLDPARTWNQMDERLIAAGFEFAPDHRSLNEAGRQSADLIGITGSGLMHLKTRLFLAPDYEALLTGSLNPGDNAVLNEETLHLIRDPKIIARYLTNYHAVLEDRAADNQWVDGAGLNVLFSPSASGPRAGSQLLKWLESENESILLMVYSLRDIDAASGGSSLVGLLKRKAKAGVPVWVITDRKQSDGVDASGAHVYRNDRTEDHLRSGGVHVYEATNRATPFSAMHHKVAILGLRQPRIITDAANWSRAALGSATTVARNRESMLFVDTATLDRPVLGRRYLAQFVRVLSRYAAQSEADGEPAYAQAKAQLLSLPGWPSLEMSFLVQAETRYGESIWVRGDLDVLGRWGEAHAGVLLGTSNADYPLWRSADATVLTVAQDFAFKLVAGYPDNPPRWEVGPNRPGFAIEQPLQTGGALVSADWR